MLKFKTFILLNFIFFIFPSCLFLNSPPIIHNQICSVIEASKPQTIIDTIEAWAVNNNQPLIFSIISGNFNNAFRIDSTTGILYVNNSNAIDFEQVPVYELAVRVKNNRKNSFSSCAKITINIRDNIEFPLDGLVAYYPFNNDANDVSGNNHSGINYGARLTTDRYNRPNSAFEFDGIGNYINTNSTFDYEYRTLSLWIYPYDMSGVSPNNRVIIVQDGPELKYGIFGAAFEEGIIGMHAGGAKPKELNLANKNAIKKWTHLVMVRKADASFYYVNGELVGTGFSNNLTSSWDTNPNLIIGAGRSMHMQFYSGKIDDIAIFNRALTEEEVIKLFQSK